MDNTQPLDTIWAVLSVDEHGEGICGTLYPIQAQMVTGSERVRDEFARQAREIAKGLAGEKSTTRLVLARFRRVRDDDEPIS